MDAPCEYVTPALEDNWGGGQTQSDPRSSLASQPKR